MLLTEATKLVQPRDHKAKICIWSDLSVSDMDLINEAATLEGIQREMERIFYLTDYNDDSKKAVLMELYCNVILFARSVGLSKEQTSCLFSIVKRTHDIASETPFGNVMETYRFFQEMMLRHSVKRPPYSIDIFSPEEVKVVAEFILNSYFRHFKMYKYVFTPSVRLDLTLTYLGLKDDQKQTEDKVDEDACEDGVLPDKGQDASVTDKMDTLQTPSETLAPPEENPALKEIKALFQNFLDAELQKLRSDVDHQLKTAEDMMNKKLALVESTGTKSPTKGKKSAGKK